MPEAFVSLWIGNFESPDDLDAFLELQYDASGHSSSPFATAFQIDWFDEDFREAEYIESTILIREALQGFSYEEKILDRFIPKVGERFEEPINSVILLYEFYYQGQVTSYNAENMSLHFVGSVMVQEMK